MPLICLKKTSVLLSQTVSFYQVDPESVHEEGSPRAPQVVFELGVPVLGICYGLQTMSEQLGGKVEPGTVHEFGYAGS